MHQCTVDISKARGAAIRASVQRAIDARAKGLGGALTVWLQGLARAELFRTLDDLPRLLAEAHYRVSRIEKAAPDDREDIQRLFDLIRAYGVVQLEDGARSGLEMVGASAGRQRRIVPTGLITEYLRTKEPLLQRLAPNTRSMARESVRRLIFDALQEQPTPSAGEIARRIRTAYHGAGGVPSWRMDATVQTGETSQWSTGQGLIYAFSSERAAAIARTELVQLENTGIFTGFEMVGVTESEWLAVTNDRDSGPRKHYNMNGQRRPLGESFVNEATGNRLRYPGDPFAPISETINCRCSMRPVSFRRPRAAA